MAMVKTAELIQHGQRFKAHGSKEWQANVVRTVPRV